MIYLDTYFRRSRTVCSLKMGEVAVSHRHQHVESLRVVELLSTVTTVLLCDKLPNY